jgi:hypothetical protein
VIYEAWLACRDYFKPRADSRPHDWFGRLEPVTSPAGVTYAGGSLCHLDVCSVATSTPWGRCDAATRQALLAHDRDTLARLLRAAPARVVFVNGTPGFTALAEAPTRFGIAASLDARLGSSALRLSVADRPCGGTRLIIATSFNVPDSWGERSAKIAALSELFRRCVDEPRSVEAAIRAGDGARFADAIALASGSAVSQPVRSAPQVVATVRRGGGNPSFDEMISPAVDYVRNRLHVPIKVERRVRRGVILETRSTKLLVVPGWDAVDVRDTYKPDVHRVAVEPGVSFLILVGYDRDRLAAMSALVVPIADWLATSYARSPSWTQPGGHYTTNIPFGSSRWSHHRDAFAQVP